MKRKFKLPLFVAIASVALTFVISAFAKADNSNSKPASGYFYKYKLSVYDEPNIRNINNYERSNDACSPGSHVCGVLLPTNQSLGQPPTSGEFSAVVDDLWDSEDAGSAQADNISMRN